jgi:hypothetical protein
MYVPAITLWWLIANLLLFIQKLYRQSATLALELHFTMCRSKANC